MADVPIVLFESQAAWRAWLEAHHNKTPEGLWLKLAKKDSGHVSVSYAEALDEALCFGWIDGQKNKFDDQFWLQKFTPRRRSSPWSRINRDKALTLIEQGRMQPAGMAEVERAQADGRWEAAYAGQRTITVPEDLQAALAQNPQAQTFFEQLNSANRYAILFHITTARKPETRQKRITEWVEKLVAGQKPHN